MGFTPQKTRRINPDDYILKIGKGDIVLSWSDLTVIATSSMVANSLDAAQILKTKGISAEVINIATIKPIDSDLILESSAKTGRVVTVEEHSIVNGLGSAVANVLSTARPTLIKKIGINDVFAVVGEY